MSVVDPFAASPILSADAVDPQALAAAVQAQEEQAKQSAGGGFDPVLDVAANLTGEAAVDGASALVDGVSAVAEGVGEVVSGVLGFIGELLS